jgi:hypothetical protein
MQFLIDCVECQRLWRVYSLATIEHIQLEGKLQAATIPQESERIAELTIMVKTAAQRRFNVRQAILEHEQAAHSGETAAAV